MNSIKQRKHNTPSPVNDITATSIPTAPRRTRSNAAVSKWKKRALVVIITILALFVGEALKGALFYSNDSLHQQQQQQQQEEHLVVVHGAILHLIHIKIHTHFIQVILIIRIMLNIKLIISSGIVIMLIITIIISTSTNKGTSNKVHNNSNSMFLLMHIINIGIVNNNNSHNHHIHTIQLLLLK
mmetsp:Transcript_22734/g.37466  ORF Transcript_22734/g.37466 Transcript_22734/m.37466 type:complete len:184 (-) Transcript_22734:2431-2982(-)